MKKYIFALSVLCFHSPAYSYELFTADCQKLASDPALKTESVDKKKLLVELFAKSVWIEAFGYSGISNFTKNLNETDVLSVAISENKTLSFLFCLKGKDSVFTPVIVLKKLPSTTGWVDIDKSLTEKYGKSTGRQPNPTDPNPLRVRKKKGFGTVVSRESDLRDISGFGQPSYSAFAWYMEEKFAANVFIPGMKEVDSDLKRKSEDALKAREIERKAKEKDLSDSL